MTKLTNQPVNNTKLKKKPFYKIPWFTTLEWIFKPRAALGFNYNSNINNNNYYYYNCDNNNNNNNNNNNLLLLVLLFLLFLLFFYQLFDAFYNCY